MTIYENQYELALTLDLVGKGRVVELFAQLSTSISKDSVK
jgi:hypothetical protein